MKKRSYNAIERRLADARLRAAEAEYIRYAGSARVVIHASRAIAKQIRDSADALEAAVGQLLEQKSPIERAIELANRKRSK